MFGSVLVAMVERNACECRKGYEEHANNCVRKLAMRVCDLSTFGCAQAHQGKLSEVIAQ